MRGSVLGAVPGGIRFRLFGFMPDLRPGLTYAAASRLECGGPFCTLHLTGQFQHFRLFPLYVRRRGSFATGETLLMTAHCPSA